MDKLIATWAKESDTLYVCSGVISNPYSIKDILGNKIAIPEAFYRAIMRKNGKTWTAAAYLIPHEYFSKPAKLEDYAIPISELERKLGIRFFVNLRKPLSGTDDRHTL